MTTRIDNGIPEEIIIPAPNRMSGPASLGRAWDERESRTTQAPDPISDEPDTEVPPEKRKVVEADMDVLRGGVVKNESRIATLEGRVDALARMVRALNRKST